MNVLPPGSSGVKHVGQLSGSFVYGHAHTTFRCTFILSIVPKERMKVAGKLNIGYVLC
jgi:hypothetical protein